MVPTILFYNTFTDDFKSTPAATLDYGIQHISILNGLPLNGLEPAKYDPIQSLMNPRAKYLDEYGPIPLTKDIINKVGGSQASWPAPTMKGYINCLGLLRRFILANRVEKKILLSHKMGFDEVGICVGSDALFSYKFVTEPTALGLFVDAIDGSITEINMLDHSTHTEVKIPIDFEGMKCVFFDIFADLNRVDFNKLEYDKISEFYQDFSQKLLDLETPFPNVDSIPVQNLSQLDRNNGVLKLELDSEEKDEVSNNDWFMEHVEIIYNKVKNSIENKHIALTLVKDEIRAALKGSYEANYFARKSQIEIDNPLVKEIPYSINSPQVILTNLLNERITTRNIVPVRLQIIDRLMRKYKFGKYQESESKNKIRIMCRKRQIKYLVHFTKIENLGGICNLGLMSREYMNHLGQKYLHNDHSRIDGQLNAISLSISFPNYKMFYKYRMQNQDQIWMAILLSPSILWEEDCLFSKHNAADSRIYKINHMLGGAVNFESMFSEQNELRSNLRNCDPTDSQAEVLVFNNINTNKILKIVFEKEKHKLFAASKTVDHCLLVDSRYFQSRMYSLKNLKN